MTAIVGLKTKTNVLIGGDSASSNRSQFSTRTDRKVFKVGPFVVGFTSSFRMGQLLQYGSGKYHLAPFKPPKSNHFGWMVAEVVPMIRSILRDGGFLQDQSNVESGGEFLMAVGKSLFTIFPDFQVAEQRTGYHAAGCGKELCLGSLHSTNGQEPRERVLKALAAAETFSSYCARPFIVLGT